MEEYESVITDSVGLTEAELDVFRRPGLTPSASNGSALLRYYVNDAALARGTARPAGLIGASIQVETKSGAVVGKFSYYVERSNGR